MAQAATARGRGCRAGATYIFEQDSIDEDLPVYDVGVEHTEGFRKVAGRVTRLGSGRAIQPHQAPQQPPRRRLGQAFACGAQHGHSSDTADMAVDTPHQALPHRPRDATVKTGPWLSSWSSHLTHGPLHCSPGASSPGSHHGEDHIHSRHHPSPQRCPCPAASAARASHGPSSGQAGRVGMRGSGQARDLGCWLGDWYPDEGLHPWDTFRKGWPMQASKWRTGLCAFGQWPPSSPCGLGARARGEDEANGAAGV